MTRLISAAIVCACSSVALAAGPTSRPAFPGAEGFGMYATGGRAGDVYAVTNLDDSGPGSLRDAVSVGNRTVVFKVSGTIELKSRLDVKVPNITIAGQTAPGDGICLKDHELFITNTENVIVRFLRVRPGDAAKKEMDAVTVWAAKDVILDHLTMSWSTDSLNDVVKESGNVTVQWCLLYEPLVNSVHKKGTHGYATGWDGRTRGGMSGHHNLIAHAAGRAPRIGYSKTGRGLIDARNNVIYNSGNSYGGETDDLNWVGNYYRPGPDSPRVRKMAGSFEAWADNAKIFAADNVVEGADFSGDAAAAVVYHPAPNPNGANGLPPQKPGTREACIVAEPHEVVAVTTERAADAYKTVLARVGAWPRDAADTRVLGDVVNRTGKHIDTPGDVGGYPELTSAPAPTDTDNDGMPDAWESSNGLNPKDPADGKAAGADGYTNLERYLNELAATLVK